MPADQSFPEGHEKDLKVKGEGPVFDVVQVVLDSLLEGSISP